MILTVAVLGAAAPAANASGGARIFHVSPQILSNVPPERQFRTISEAAHIVAAGDTVRIYDGLYRESVTIDHSGTRERPITFEAAPNAHVVVTGADRLLDWTKEGAEAENIFSTRWPHEFITAEPTRSYPAGDYHLLIGRAEQVHVDGMPLRQVLAQQQLARGTFFVDPVTKRLSVWADNNANLIGRPDWSPQVDASTRSVLWNCTGAFVHLRGVRFRFAANRAQQAATQFAGAGDVVEDCTFERTNSCGAVFLAPDQVVRRCTFQRNGQIGFVAVRAHRLRFSDCTVRNNNTKNFDQNWEAGGNKIVLSRDVVIERSRFLDNRGPGIWFDIGNENCTVRNCLIAGNEAAGLFYEISFRLSAHDNVVTGNGFLAAAGAWGAAAGIALSSSADCVVERNLLVGNREGFNFREQGRTTARIDAAAGAPEEPIWNHDDVLRRNIIAYNRDAQTWGWFDVSDERHWPVALRENLPGATPLRPPGVPELSLPKLRLTLRENVYAFAQGQGCFRWGVPWQQHEFYDGADALKQAQRRLHLEQGSTIAPLTFANWRSLDFRLPASSSRKTRDAYPRGKVPGVKLGFSL
ncbi:MAG: right-handed parallel beta-helix repeat-containing protein [Verrucomicrobiota bacterium]|nr:right-handed parallel beta-helix repeat-containing protein [Verrucomicrobiota bacterium]